MDDGRRERMEILKKRMDNKDVKINPMEMLRLNENQRNEFQKIQKKYREFFNNFKNSLKKKHLELAKKLGAENTFIYSSNQEQFLQDVSKKYGLFDAAIVFAPVDQVTDTAIKSIKKGGLVVIATVGKIPNFLAFEEKTIRGTLIGSRKDMEDVIKISDENKLEVITETFPLEQVNQALIKLKNSEMDARAVLIP